MTDKEKPIPKPPTKKAYEKQALEMLQAWAPEIRPCSHCKWPVMEGYCCNSCGNNDP